MTDPDKSSSSIRRWAKEKSQPPFARLRAWGRIAEWILLCLLGLVYVVFLSAMKNGRVPLIDNSLKNTVLLSLPVLLFLVYFVLRERNKSEAYGKKLFAKSRYAKARRVLERTRDTRSSEASKIMGDMYLAGLGGAADPERAVECYTAALERFRFDDLYSAGPEEAPKEWLEDVLARIRPLADSGNPGALELAATLSQRLGRPEEALACVRRLPDDDGKPGWQTECLVKLIREERRTSRSANDAEKSESADPDIRVPLTWRSNAAQSTAFPFMIAFIAFMLFLAGVEHPEGDFGPYPVPLFLLFLLFAACGGIVLYRRRKGYYRLGRSALAREKFDLAAQYFSRGVNDSDPRAAKMLGDMRQYGLGFGKDPALAFAGYEKSMVLVEVCRILRRAQKKEKLFGRLLTYLFFRSMLPGMPEKKEPALWSELRRSLSDLLATGFDGDKVCGTLFHVLQQMNDWQAIREFGEKLPPTPENLTTLAGGVIHDPDAGEADVAAAMETLEQLAEEGHIFAAGRLSVHYGGIGPREEQLENADKARAYLSATFGMADALPESERRNALENSGLTVELLLERHGAGFLDDEQCLMAMRRD